jgi:hypothetical protein
MVMDSNFSQFLLEWKKPFLRDQDLITVFRGEDTRRYDAVKHAIKKGVLIHVKRGVYIVGRPYGQGMRDPFELAEMLYGPSYISFESALSHHGWIPEAVYVTTSACAKRSKMIETKVGNFRYSHTPAAHFFMNVVRQTNGQSIFLLAEPWKAVGDMIYSHKKSWKSIADLTLDLRIEQETIRSSDFASLVHIASYYDSTRVRQILSGFAKELI